MKAEIKYYHSPDIYDLVTFRPEDETCFGFALQVLVGPEGSDAADSFNLYVCTPRWLEEEFTSSDIIFGEHYLIVFNYNYDQIVSKISEYITSLDEDNWEFLASKIDRIGKWEFRDYQEFDESSLE